MEAQIASATSELGPRPNQQEELYAEIFVTAGKTIPVLGLKSCIALELGENFRPERDKLVLSNTVQPQEQPLDLRQVLDEYANAFEGLRKFQGSYHISIREDAEPVIHPPR